MNTLRTYGDCLRLNARAFRLLINRAWITGRDVAASYDRIAPEYDTNWQSRLRPVTDTLLAHLPPAGPGTILDLGCGTGYTTAWLAERQPPSPIIAVDSSPGMLEQARARIPPDRVEFMPADLLNFLTQQPNESVAQIVSAWAIGYSRPRQVIQQAARSLRAGGVFAFVVNCADTLLPIQRAFRKCMARYPQFLKRIAFPGFPASRASVQQILRHSGFQIVWFDEARHPVGTDTAPGTPILPWLLKTGILAGFDRMLPLHEPGPVSSYFEELLQQNKDPFLHHYLAAVVRCP